MSKRSDISKPIKTATRTAKRTSQTRKNSATVPIGAVSEGGEEGIAVHPVGVMQAIDWSFAPPFEAFIEAVPDGIAVYDLQGRVVRSNAAYRDTLARFIPKDPAATLRERVKQAPMLDAHGHPLPEDQWPHTRMLRGEALSGSAAVEVSMHTIAGEALHMSVTGSPLLAEDGRIIGAVAIHRDITAQKRLEAEREKLVHEAREARAQAEATAARLQTVLEILPVGVSIVDAHGKPALVNDAVRAIWGAQLPLSEGVEQYEEYKAWWPQTGQQVRSHEWGLARALSSGEIVSGDEIEIETFDGERKFILNADAPIRDAQGRITGAVSVIFDLTDRKRLERQVAEEAERLQTIFSSITDAVFLFDAHGQVLDANPAGRRQLPDTGANFNDQARAERVAAYLPKDEHGTLIGMEEWPVTRLLRGETLTGKHAVDMLVRMPDGDERWLSIGGAPVRDAQGKVVGAVGVTRDITERKRLENELAERVSLLTAVFNAVPGRLTIFDASGNIMQLNAAAAQLEEQERGRATLETLGEALQLRTPDGKPFPVHELPLLRALRGELVSGIEVRFRDATGRDQSSMNSAAPFYDGAGQLRGVVALAHDVTALREAERVAVERAAQLDAVFDALTDGLFVYDATGQLTRMNDAARKLVALDAMPTFPTLPRTERAARLNVRNSTDQPLGPDEGGVSALLEGAQQQADFDFRITALDGVVKDVSLTGSLIHDPQGAVMGAVTLLRDVTERRQMQREIVESEARLRALTEAAPQLVWSATPDGAATYVNSQWERYTGRAQEQLLGAGWLTALHPDDRDATAAAWHTAVTTGDDYDIAYRIRRFDGAYRWFQARGVALRDADGPILQWFGACADIHDLRETQEALQQERERLEQRVRERTRELAKANRSLRRLSQQILDVQERERRTIALELHDEIGQALTGAKMMLELLETYGVQANVSPPQPPLSEPRRLPELSEVRATIGAALQHVRDLSLDLRPAILDSMGLLPALLWQFERFTQQSGIVVKFHQTGLDQRLPLGTETVAYRIIQEALTNVARHAAVSQVVIQIRANGETLRLFVVDEGAGFDLERAQETRLSIGLAGMRERADLLGGTLRISSAPGEGTTIEAELPLVTPSATGNPLPASNERNKQEG